MSGPVDPLVDVRQKLAETIEGARETSRLAARMAGAAARRQKEETMDEDQQEPRAPLLTTWLGIALLSWITLTLIALTGYLWQHS